VVTFQKWPIGCKLLCVGGDRLQAPDSVPVPSVKPGSSIDLSLRMLTPSAAGRYIGYWRLCTDDGTRFGQRMWVDVNVVDPLGGGEVRVPAPEPIVRQNQVPDVCIPAAVPVVAPTVPAPVPTPLPVTTAPPVPTPPPVPTLPPVPVPRKSAAEIKWEAALESLTDMGFLDTRRNIVLLEAHDGDLSAVIGALL
jgi:next to BRCA1 gene 1 protein